MAKQFPALEAQHQTFIKRQHIFFTATAAAGARVNISPRGMDTFRVIDAATVAYLDRTGSGNETAAHLKADGRMTIMFCAVDGPPLILRLYGRWATHQRRSRRYAELLAQHFEGQEPPGARQIVVLAVDLVQTSCGYGVPLYDFKGERDNLDRWASHKGEDGVEAYRREKNTHSIDGLPTGLNEDV